MASDIAVIGMGVMGRNIALNLADHGFNVAVYNRTPDKTREAMQLVTSGQQVIAADTTAQLCAELSSPRVVFIMVTAGAPVDWVIKEVLPLLDPGDVIIDGGNSNFHDTQRRWEEVKKTGIHYLGVGVSGGEEGARYGPSIMPGGDAAAWPIVKPMLQAIAARSEDGEICCQWVGEGGAGHYVKMIHNGIEYGDMQLIAESWQLMQSLGVDEAKIADTFAEWNSGVLQSYLIEITADILKVTDPGGALRVHSILDSAGQKGTGRWTAIDSLELGAPLTLICEAVYARMLSAIKSQRVQAAAKRNRSAMPFNGDLAVALSDLHDALYAAKIISYAQGFMQMNMAAGEYGWKLEYGNIAMLWRAGCIIRSRFLSAIKQAFEKQPELENLLLDDFFARTLVKLEEGWRNSCVRGIQQAAPMPGMNSALNFYDGYLSATLSANLIQAQRDYFGAHTYQRVDQPASKVFHTHWLEGAKEEIVHD